MIRVAVFNAHPRRRVRHAPVKRTVRLVLRGEKIPRGEVAVVFADRRHVRRINREYLSHDYDTDVISFPLETGDRLEGEIYVNLDRAREQARDYRVTEAEEIARLVVHGTLHLAGYDDRTPRQAARMTRMQERYVRRAPARVWKPGKP
jgi:rRNA maturation RNase YbeY